MLIIRLDKKLEAEIEKVSKSENIRKSDLIRRSITEYLKKNKKPAIIEVGEEMFNKYSFKDSELSKNSEKILRDLYS